MRNGAETIKIVGILNGGSDRRIKRMRSVSRKRLGVTPIENTSEKQIEFVADVTRKKVLSARFNGSATILIKSGLGPEGGGLALPTLGHTQPRMCRLCSRPKTANAPIARLM
jgi:hypothetical protein